MPVQFDTGSSGAYLITDNCKSEGCQQSSVQKYQTKSSSYFLMESEDKDARTEINYGKGFISGPTATDRVCFTAGDDHCMMNF
jgi:meiotically up-regulated gene 157 (Mug157) protein